MVLAHGLAQSPTECSTTLGLGAFPAVSSDVAPGRTVSQVTKTTHRLNDSLEECTGPRKAITLLVRVYSNERIQIKMSKGKRRVG